MVEASAEALSFKGMIVGNPQVQRGRRVNMFFSEKKPNLLVYAIMDNLIFRDTENPFNSKVYAGHRAKITSVAEQKTAGKFAFGDEKGVVTVVTLKQDGSVGKEKDYPFIAGEINQVVWSHDGTRIVAVGAGTDIKANAVTADTGSKCGTILGFTSTQLCSDLALIDKRSALFTGGEGSEILVHEGFPFKGQGKSTGAVHSNFTNQLRVSPDNTKFVTVSSDKSIVVHDVASQAVLSKTDAAHEMGVYDARWLDNNLVATCSADNTLKLWSVAADGAIEHKDTFVQHDGPKDTQMQLLGLAETKDASLTAVNLNGELVHYQSVTSAADKHPTSVSRRHAHLITDLIAFDRFVVYASEHRIFYFDAATPNDVHVVTGTPNKQTVLEFEQNSFSLYASTLDKFVLRLSVNEDGKSLVLVKSLDLKSAAAKSLGAGDDALYVMRSNGEIDEVDALELTVKRSHKHGIDATCMTYAQSSKQLWIGDKKGLLHVINASDFKTQQTIEKHSKAVTVLTANHEGTQVASGDGYRY